MKTMLKVTLMIALLGTTVLADGQMGSGGREGCTGENCPPPPPCTENCGFTNPVDEEFIADSTEIIVDVATELVEEYFFTF